jgi:hypothetical protein
MQIRSTVTGPFIGTLVATRGANDEITALEGTDSSRMSRMEQTLEIGPSDWATEGEDKTGKVQFQ